MKNLKRIIAMVLSLGAILCLSVSLTTTVFADDDIDNYNVWIGGTQITSANASDVFDDGKVRFNPSDSTLTLEGYSYSGAGYNGSALYSETDINIIVVGNNSLTSNADNGFGINSGGSISVAGSDNNSEFNVSASNTGGFAVNAAGSSASFNNVTMNIAGNRGIVVNQSNASDAITIDSCTMTFANGVDRSLQVWNESGSASLDISNSDLSGKGRQMIIAEGSSANAVCNITSSTVNLAGTYGMQLEAYYGDASIKIDSSDVTLQGTNSANGSINLGARNDGKATLDIINNSSVKCSGSLSGINVWTWGTTNDRGTEINVINSVVEASGNHYGLSTYGYLLGDAKVNFVNSTIKSTGGFSGIEICCDPSYNATGSRIYTQTDSVVTVFGGYYGLDVDSSTQNKDSTGKSSISVSGGSLNSTGMIFSDGDQNTNEISMSDTDVSIDMSGWDYVSGKPHVWS